MSNNVEAMLQKFTKRIFPENRILARAKQLIPHYAVWNNERNAFVCSYCGEEVPRQKIKLNRSGICPSCDSNVMFIQKRYRFDTLWIFTPSLGKGSYWHYIQTVHENGTVDTWFREEARYTIDKDGNKQYWTRSGAADDSWHSGKPPHFVRSCGCYKDRADWCERNYIIPSQFQSYLEQAIPGIENLGFNKKHPFGDNTLDTWADIACDMPADVDSMTPQRKKTLRLLMDNNLTDIAMYYMFNTNEYWNEDNARQYLRHPKINTFGRTLRSVLCLDALQFEEFMKTDRSFASFERVSYCKKGYPELFNMKPDHDSVIKYRHMAEAALEKDGMSLNKLYICPAENKESGYVYLRYAPVKSGKRINLAEQILVKDESSKKILLKGKYRMVTTNKLDLKDAEISFDAFNKIVSETSLYDKDLQCVFKKSNVMRVKLVEHPSIKMNIVVWEKLRNAGFKTLAKEFYSSIRNMREIEWHTIDTSNGKLNTYMGIPVRFFDKLDRKNVTVKDVYKMQKAYAACPDISYEDYMSFNLMYPYEDLTADMVNNGQSIHETISYFLSKYKHSKVQPGEYERYIKNLNVLHPNRHISRKQAFPEDFEKAQIEADGLAQNVRNKSAMKAMQRISKALRSDRTITRFFQKNTKYLVFVPESPKELIEESKRLHNCLKTYVQAVAEGNTSVFFIRKADCPDNAFVAMEYKNGQLIQIHSDCNRDVDEDVARFANRFIKVLNKINYDPKQYLAAA